MGKITLKQWLQKKYADWIKTQDGIPPQAEFASFLELGPEDFSRHLNGKRKSFTYEKALQIAKKLEDYEILDILGYPRPPASDLLSSLPPEVREPILSGIIAANEEVVKSGTTIRSDELVEKIRQAFLKFGVDVKIDSRN